MKKVSKIALALGCIAATANTFAMDENGWASTYESLSAFEDKGIDNQSFNNRPGYVKPIISNLGNVLNSNWYVSASVPQSITFEVGMPFSIIPIGNDDKVFTEPGVLPDGTPFSAERPTIFGDHAPLYPNGLGGMSPNYMDATVYGNETLNGLGVFTYPYLQLAGGFYHARVVLRGMFLPSISNLKKFNLFGFGLQYSFGHFFQYMLHPAAQGLDVSLAFGYSTSGIGYQPDNYEGSLDLDVSATTFDVVIGYKPINLVEVMLTLGYQSATMKSSGHLESKEEGSYGKQINPNISVDGNCGFKFGIAVAFQLGSSFHPVLGYDYAGKSSFTTNVLYFRQQLGTDKTPAEIAKDKGYAPGAHDEKNVQEEKEPNDTSDSFGEMDSTPSENGFDNEDPSETPSYEEDNVPSYDDGF